MFAQLKVKYADSADIMPEFRGKEMVFDMPDQLTLGHNLNAAVGLLYNKQATLVEVIPVAKESEDMALAFNMTSSNLQSVQQLSAHIRGVGEAPQTH